MFVFADICRNVINFNSIYKNNTNDSHCLLVHICCVAVLHRRHIIYSSTYSMRGAVAVSYSINYIELYDQIIYWLALYLIEVAAAADYGVFIT